MAKAYLTKEMMSNMTTMAISVGAVVVSVLMMFIIFITTILMIGLLFS